MINNFLKWAGCVIAIAGAICVTLKIDPLNVYLGNIGAILYMTWGIRIREYNIALVNLCFLLIYGYGLLLRVI